ncbi:MAG: class C sortase [Olsenella sp.]|nr:class C sortase [Olsenella sp.]
MLHSIGHTPRRPEGADAPSGRSRRGRRSARALAFAILLALAGIAAILYPYASDYLARREQAAVGERQQDVVAQAPKQDLTDEWEAAREFNRRQLEGRVVVSDPFDPNNSTPSDEEYAEVLNLAGDGVMGQLVIPSIGVNLPIYHGVSDDQLLRGVGHLPTTSLPIGGPSTHCVLAGHTGLPSAKILGDIDQLKEGDWFIIRVLGEDHAYRVTSTEVVLPTETQSLVTQDGRDLVTLVTCTPYGVNTHRLLVHAERCEVPQEWLDMQNQADDVPLLSPADEGAPLVVLSLIGLGAGAGLILLSWATARRGGKRPSSRGPRHMRK